MRWPDQSVHVEKGPIGKRLLAFAVPVLASQLLQEFYNIADCAIVGHFGGAYALAATGLAGLILSVLINFFVGFSSGISAWTSRMFGSYEYGRLREAIEEIIVLTLIVGGVLSLACGLLSRGIFRLLSSPESIVPTAETYLCLCLVGLPAQMFANTGTAVLRSLGDTLSPMLLFLGSALMNLALDCLLVIGLKLGAGGAAAATAMAQWMLAAALWQKLRRLDPAYAPRFRNLSVRWRELSGILRLGMPAGLQAVWMSISSLLLQVCINAFGADAVAGMTVFAKVEGFLYFPSFAYGIALTGFVGQNLGAGEYGRIRKAVRLSAWTVCLYTGLMSAVLVAQRGPILRLFTSDEAILVHAEEAVRWILPFYLFYGLNQILLGVIKGMGDTVYPMLCTLISYCLFRVLWCHVLLAHIPKIHIVYLSYDVSFFLMLAMLLVRYQREGPGR